MDNNDIKKYQEELLKEKNKIDNLITKMRKNDTIDSNLNDLNELSYYDNHPSDIASEIYDISKGVALKENELALKKKVDEALEKVKVGNYGICDMCHKDIEKERLDFIPYARFCVHCQKEIDERKGETFENRPIEESVLEDLYTRGFSKNPNDSGTNAKDIYDLIESHNKDSYEKDLGDNFVEEIEGISNDSYVNIVESQGD